MESTVDEALPSAENLKSRLEFEALSSDLSSIFINLPPDKVDSEIENALCRVCEPLGIDLAVLWQWSGAAAPIITPTHAYYAQEGLRFSEPLCQELFPWVVQQMLAGRMVILSSLEDMPAEAAIDRESACRFGIKSDLCLPLSLGGEPPVGALAFNTLREERCWPEVLVKQLQTIAQIIANALARRRQERKLQESQERLATGAELAGLAFYEVDFGEGVAKVDERFCDLLGFRAGQEHDLEPLGFWVKQMHPDDRERVLELRRQLHDGRLEKISVEYRFLHPSLGEKWIHHLARVAKRDSTGRAVLTFGVLRDITETKQTEDSLRDLTRRLIHAHEEEHALLARELHDDVTQRLAVLAIDVGRAEVAAQEKSQIEAMRAVRAGLVRLSEDIHSLAYQLHPSVLDELGLVEALRAECERRVRQGQLNMSTDLNPYSADVGKNAALCLFRVAQEAMNNVARHAGARIASVTLRDMKGGLLLVVRDDGVGFDPMRPRSGRSLGLANMRERVWLVNGTFNIESTPGRGTSIIAWVPAEGGAR